MSDRERLDDNGGKYTTLSDRDDLEGLAYDSEVLNWLLFEAAVRLGKVERSENQDAGLDVVPVDLAQEFLKEYDRLRAAEKTWL